MRSLKKVLFLGKADDQHTLRAIEYCRLCFEDVEVHLGVWGDPLPAGARSWQGEYLISFLSRWVVPPEILEHANTAAVNFHPGPPEYPGIGCNNFALYEDASEYGVTCHHMAPRVDTGSIVDVRRFRLLDRDNVRTLLDRTYDVMLVQFYDIVGRLAEHGTLPHSSESWTRVPFTREEFDKLGRIAPGMSHDEVSRRIRATSFGQWQPVVDIGGFLFELKTDSSVD